MAITATSSLDVNSIVTQLMTLEQRPISLLETKEAAYQAKISAYGTVKGALSALQTALAPLARTATFTAQSATSSDTTVLSATASGVSSGTYNIQVTQVAKAHTVRSNDAYTSASDTFNTGTLSIKVGSGAAIDIDITSSNNTLSNIRNAINNANAGVNASIVNDGTNQRLVLTSKTLGENGAITVTATEDGVTSGTFALTGLDSSTLVEAQAADNAELTVNGLAVSRSTNTVSDVISGMTLNLSKAGSSTVTVGRNNTDLATVVSGFVTAYNDVIKQNKSLTAFDVTNQTQAILNGDSTVRSIQTNLSNLLLGSVEGLSGGISSLADIGISYNRDGTLSLNSATLSAALNNPDKDVAGLFSQITSGNQGIAVRMNNWLTKELGSDGMIGNSIDTINDSITSLDEQKQRLTDKLVIIEARYRRQYSALDALITSMSQTSSFLEQQLANLPTIGKNN